ncbi:response regulator [Paenibacillus sp. LHD-117]|uniref:response regulator n=1 Tax=Paenibacillus sp. LHD-117 TaxID=3071412 RepID=UPI0027E01D97|nr:response regulator [Paenibacillus sp. LHD-117]MDQ6420503.1 response regulator [Paenibacillus sp. LHD-117]
MYNVMMADDEALFRDYLRTAAEWDTLGMRLMWEARNGEEALTLLESHKPDIALLDISMPIIDGLAVAESLKEKYPDCTIIMVTGHNEFEYARRALRLGIEDYLLKPFDRDELYRTLLTAKTRLDRLLLERNSATRDSDILKERFLNYLLVRNGMKKEACLQGFQRFGMPKHASKWQAIAISIDRLHQQWPDPDQVSLWKYAVSNIVVHLKDREANLEVVPAQEDRLLLLVSDPEEDRVLLLAERIVQAAKHYLKLSVSVGIGRTVSDTCELWMSWREALQALEHRVTLGEGRVLVYDKLNSNPEVFYSVDCHERLLTALRTGDEMSANAELRELFRTVKERHISPDAARGLIAGLVSLCMSYLAEMNCRLEDVFGKGFFPFAEAEANPSLDEAADWLCRFYSQVIAFRSGKRSTRSRQIVEDTLALIRTHYRNPELMVEDIAASLYINASYLRRIIKRETDLTVSDHLTQVRMQKASELLTGGGIRFADIAEEVGYNDAGYFSKCFKRHFGVSPREYEQLKMTEK